MKRRSTQLSKPLRPLVLGVGVWYNVEHESCRVQRLLKMV